MSLGAAVISDSLITLSPPDGASHSKCTENCVKDPPTVGRTGREATGVWGYLRCSAWCVGQSTGIAHNARGQSTGIAHKARDTLHIIKTHNKRLTQTLQVKMLMVLLRTGNRLPNAASSGPRETLKMFHSGIRQQWPTS